MNNAICVRCFRAQHYFHYETTTTVVHCSFLKQIYIATKNTPRPRPAHCQYYAPTSTTAQLNIIPIGSYAEISTHHIDKASLPILLKLRMGITT